ncbi:hypothetical protein ACE15N_21500 [Xanthomonas campestris pv. passiflorae]|uniref:hypothetical protein n=1 Tax=Xanthomonas campestris TaxID=339 RepID=UPI002424A1B5|nr:hypothetical protein [Xanthomonas campestris pv. passiflorae]
MRSSPQRQDSKTGLAAIACVLRQVSPACAAGGLPAAYPSLLQIRQRDCCPAALGLEIGTGPTAI